MAFSTRFRFRNYPRFLLGALGDMWYRATNGNLTPVAGTKATGKAPVIQSDGSVAWASPASSTRTATTITTGILAASGQETGSFPLAKASVLVRAVAVFNRQCRIRIYGTAAARDADVARPVSTSATSGSSSTGTGCSCDLVLSSAEGYDLKLDPKAVLADPVTTPGTTLYYTMDNLTSGNVPAVVTLYHTPIEA